MWDRMQMKASGPKRKFRTVIESPAYRVVHYAGPGGWVLSHTEHREHEEDWVDPARWHKGTGS